MILGKHFHLNLLLVNWKLTQIALPLAILYSDPTYNPTYLTTIHRVDAKI